jgi:hypothetical protein
MTCARKDGGLLLDGSLKDVVKAIKNNAFNGFEGCLEGINSPLRYRFATPDQPRRAI